MAHLMLPDGKIVNVKPAGGRYFTLEEMQQAVGGYIEMVHLPSGRVLVVNEEGLLKGLPENPRASMLWQTEFGVANGNIVGAALVCGKGEVN